MSTIKNDLFDYIKRVSTEIQDEYIRIQKRALEDPGTAGDQGEENWATILREWLSPEFQVVTKGRIINDKGETSPQIDILILSPAYPKKLLDKKLYLAGGILAAFECKITLKAEDIKKVFENSVKIRKLYSRRVGSPYKELNSPIIYGLLAHSHSWKKENSSPFSVIENHIMTADKSLSHPSEMVDMICVADLATWAASKMTITGAGEGAGTSYICFSQHNTNSNFTSTGAAIANLLEKISWKYSPSQKIADHFRKANIAGSGKGILRKWPFSIYSESVQKGIASGRLKNGELWDEWTMVFP